MRRGHSVILSSILAFAICFCSYAQTLPSTPRPAAKINPKDSLTYVWIPPGTYRMGCSFNDSKCSDYEKPAHRVTIAKGFWIGQTPVTQAAYKKIMGTNPSHFKGDERPVERVTWDEAKQYCERVEMKLPTEEEWEYAARGGNRSALYGPLPQIAWYRNNSGGSTHPVAQKQPNAYGLYDMLGNVDEWVADFYASYPGPTDPAMASMPESPGASVYVPPVEAISKVVRGASWDNDAYLASASNRMRYDPGNRHQNVGFRCAANSL